MTLAVLLALRHRTVRLAAALAAVVLLLAALRRATDSVGGSEATALVVAGSLGAVAASRLLGSRTALGALRNAAAPWWLPPGARLAGVALLLVPVVGVATAALVGSGGDSDGPIRFGGVVWVASTACAAGTLALSPFLGASVSGSLGLLAVWFGGIPPSAMHNLFSGWTVVQRPVVLLWNTLPLGWRATRWLQQGEAADGLMLGVWIVAGIVIGGWGAARAALRDRGVEP